MPDVGASGGLPYQSNATISPCVVSACFEGLRTGIPQMGGYAWGFPEGKARGL